MYHCSNESSNYAFNQYKYIDIEELLPISNGVSLEHCGPTLREKKTHEASRKILIVIKNYSLALINMWEKKIFSLGMSLERCGPNFIVVGTFSGSEVRV